MVEFFFNFGPFLVTFWIPLFAHFFSTYLALDVTANCICEIHCLGLDGFDLKAVTRKILVEPGGKQEC